MTRIINTLKKAMPSALWRPASKTYWWWRNRGQHQLAAVFSARRKQSVRILRQYRNCHRAQRCFIIGNGPSLQKTDLSLLRNEITFGMNRIYLLFPRMGFPTTYYVSINTLVIEQCAEEIKSLTMPKFITWRGRHWLANDPGSIFLDTDYTCPETFSGDVCGRIFEGSTVTYVALQIAFHMGFETVILIGVDHSFKTKGPANATVISQGEDINHFAPDYFGKGFKWQLPDLEASERAYHLARQAYDDAGRSVLDATVGGKLTVFSKADYNELIKSSHH